MELKEFMDNFDRECNVKIVKGEDELFEGKAGVLRDLLFADVRPKSSKGLNDYVHIEIR